MKKLLTLSLTAFALCAAPVFAKVAMADRAERVAAPNIYMANGMMNPGCGMTENAQVSITFNGMEQDASTIKAKFDAKVADIETVFKDAKLTKYEMQSMNYSISPQNYGNGAPSMYQFNGSISFMILPSSKATSLMEQLTKKGYQTSVNVSAYRNGGMPCPQTPKE